MRVRIHNVGYCYQDEKLNTDNELLLSGSEVDINYPVAKNLFGQTTEFLNAVKKVDCEKLQGFDSLRDL